MVNQRVPISGVAISLSKAPASFWFLLFALIEKLPPAKSDLQVLQAPPSIAAKFMTPRGKFSGWPPLSGGTNARPV